MKGRIESISTELGIWSVMLLSTSSWRYRSREDTSIEEGVVSREQWGHVAECNSGILERLRVEYAY